MSKSKKLLSVLLALIMALSVTTMGLVASAQSPAKARAADAAVTAVEDKINAYQGDMDTKDPTAEDKAGYEALIAAFQGLTGDQKDSIDPLALDKLTQLMYKYYRAVNGTSTQVRKEAAEYIVKTLDCPALTEANEAANAGIVNASTTAKAVELYNGLHSELARIMVGTAYYSYGLFYESITATNSYTNGAMYNLVYKV